MPKFKKPKNGCGLNLRAVIEGELMNLPWFKLGYETAKELATVIEKRIQDGPSDWLSLSDGTTFDKSWVPEAGDPIYFLKSIPKPTPTKLSRVESFGKNLHENLIQTIGLAQEDKLGALGHDSNRLLVKSLKIISSEHEKRVAAHKLEHEIQAHEDWLESERIDRLR
jgi:hypothetical protein